MPLPLPDSLEDLLRRDLRNPSLAFDKTFDGYSWTDQTVSIVTSGKPDFLNKFASDYRNAEYGTFFKRRSVTLAPFTRAFEARLQSRLVIGLGLAHPTETGLLIDRFSGAVYIPGSTVKGLLRSACEQIAEGRLEHPPSLQPLIEERRSWFGDQSATGRLTCYDAFPVTWPKLAVDIMTPHYSDYHSSPESAPGDWESPTPVAFLTVESGQQFRFWFSFRGAAEPN